MAVGLPGGVPAYGILVPGPGLHSEKSRSGSNGPGLGYISSAPSTEKEYKEEKVNYKKQN